MSDAHPIAPEELFQHAEFLKHLARRLLRDEHLAEDVAQEALVAALEHPPRERGALRAWLARTARNLASNRRKADAGRTRRERASSRPERLDLHGEALERLELQRLVFEQVLALDEVKRTALFLRYHEGLEPAAIAERLGVPIKTVKTRLARGLEELRARLERRYDGDRKALGLALAVLSRGPATSTLAAAIGAGLATKWVLGVVAAVVAWLAWQGVRMPARGEPRELGRIGDQVLLAYPEGTTEWRTASVTREARAPAAPSRQASFVLTGSVRGREDRQPIAGAVVGVHAWGEPGSEHLLTTGPDGRFRLELGEPTTVSQLSVRPTPTTAASTRSLGERLVAGEPLDVELLVTGGARLTGRVVDTLGNPVGGATVRAWCRTEYVPSSPEDRRTTTAPGGTFELEHLGESFALCAEKPGLACLHGLRGVLAAGSRADGLEVVMDEAVLLRGQVVDELGRPIGNAELESRPHTSSSDEDATSVVGVQRFYAHDVRARTGHDGSFALGPVARQRWGVRISHPEFLYVDGPLEPDADNLIELARGFRVGGVVLDPEGGPVPDAKVHVHPQLGEERRTTTDATGRFEVSALCATENGFVLVIADGHAVLARQPIRIGPDAPSFVELRLEPPAPLAGRVLDANGLPVADARVRAEGERLLVFDDVDFGERTTWEWRAGCNEERTDGEGRFRFAQLYEGPFRLLASPPDAPELRAEVRARSGQEDVEIVLDRAALERVVFTGTARDGSTGEPLAEFTIAPMFRTTDGVLTGNTRSFGPEARGSFRLAGHEAGHYELEVSAPGYALWNGGLREFSEGEHRIEAVVWPACTVRISAIGERGEPLSARLVFHDIEGHRLSVDHGTWTSSSITVDGRNQVVPGLPRHVVRVTATAAGHLETSLDLDLTVPPLEPIVLAMRAVPELR